MHGKKSFNEKRAFLDINSIFFSNTHFANNEELQIFCVENRGLTCFFSPIYQHYYQRSDIIEKPGRWQILSLSETERLILFLFSLLPNVS